MKKTTKQIALMSIIMFMVLFAFLYFLFAIGLTNYKWFNLMIVALIGGLSAFIAAVIIKKILK